MQQEEIRGFSKLTKEDKIQWLATEYMEFDSFKKVVKQYQNSNGKLQQLHDEFSENTLTNFYMPFGVAPNFLINGRFYTIPMAIEESSVVAAASKAAKFWLSRGGFRTQVLGRTKIGHVHFMFEGDGEALKALFEKNKQRFYEATDEITKNMRKRGGGILNLEIKDKTDEIDGYYQLEGHFNTVDSMGANFINSCLETFAATLEKVIEEQGDLDAKESFEVVMSILSNYTPECIVRAEVSCPVEQLADEGVSSEEFIRKFNRAVRIAQVEPYRATTHNKGIMNGVDAVVIATGNDFRAVEACVHTYASRSGKYSGLTQCEVKDGQFRFWLDLPLALGTVGGLTALHPLVKTALKLLHDPSAEELMGICAVAGLAQNFAALRSLVTTGIQKGHMKMHLLNILNQLGATEREKQYFVIYFKDKTVSHSAVVEEFKRIRGKA